MKRKRNLLILLALPALAGYLIIENNLPPKVDQTAPVPPGQETQTNAPRTDTPPPAPADEGCYFVWANHDLPELTGEFDTAVRAIQAAASGRASAFGEDCIHADGRSTFGAMETDFYVRIQADDLHNEEAFGNWITQVMAVIEQIPPEEIPGPQPGFVEFSFTKSDTEKIILRVPIRDYKETAGGKSGAELFRMFYVPPVNPT